MKIKRRLKITITQRRVLRSGPAPVQAFCPDCAQVAEVLEIDGQALADLIAAGRGYPRINPRDGHDLLTDYAAAGESDGELLAGNSAPSLAAGDPDEG